MVQPIKRVAVIGAGVSGVAAAAHLKASNVDVTLYDLKLTSQNLYTY
jgi:cation diffusion facilitator CzcD-associated flavoprotein CzcO